MKTVITSLIVIQLFLLGCQKDKLEGNWQILEGEWQWIESKGPCGTKNSNACYYTPQTEDFTESLELVQKGKYSRTRDGELLEKGRVTLEQRQEDFYSPWGFWISFHGSILNEPEYEQITGYFITSDTLVLSDFPFEIGTGVKSYFVKK